MDLRTFPGRKVMAILGSGVLGAGILGSVAFAATAGPTGDGATTAIPSDQVAAAATDEKGDKGDKGRAKLKAVLDALVDRGVITRAQADAILDALAKTHERRPDLRHFVGDVARESVAYLGLPADDVKRQLAAGKSLGEIANATPGKSRDGLLRTLDDSANVRIKAAVDAGTITPQQAETIRTKVDEAIVKIVDHEGRPKPKP